MHHTTPGMKYPEHVQTKKVRNEIQPLPSVFPTNGYPVETIDKIMMKQTQQRRCS